MDENTDILTVPGFSDFQVTSAGKVFKTQHLKKGDKTIEIRANEEDVYNLVSDEGTRHRYPLNRILLATRNGVDPRSDEARELVKAELERQMVTTLPERLSAAGSDLRKSEELANDVQTAILSEIKSKGQEVSDATALLANIIAHDVLLYYRMWKDVNELDDLTVIEKSREGNSRSSINGLVGAMQKQSEVVKKGLAQLGVDFSQLQKKTQEVRRQLSLFEDADEDDVIELT